MVTGTDEPPGVIVPVKSAQSFKVTVTLPVLVVVGSISTVYVPVVGSVFVSMNEPEVEPSDEPSGFLMLYVQLEIVESAKLRLTFCPAVPSNVSTPFCPGDVIVTPTAGPPMLIVPLMSAATS
jgi:hypothetical protein